MQRIIVDFKKLTPKILNLLVEKFPEGYGVRDIVKFTNHKGQYIEALEVTTNDTIYLVKVSQDLMDSMESFDIAIPDVDPNIDLSNEFEDK